MENVVSSIIPFTILFSIRLQAKGEMYVPPIYNIHYFESSIFQIYFLYYYTV